MVINRIMCTLKILTDLCFTRQRIKTKNTFIKVVYCVLVVKMCWQNIKRFVWALVHGAQSVTVEKGTNEFKNYFKQIPVPFYIYADSECNLKTVESYEGSYSKN